MAGVLLAGGLLEQWLEGSPACKRLETSRKCPVSAILTLTQRCTITRARSCVERCPTGTDDSPKELSEAVQQTKLLLCLFELGLPLALSTFYVCVVSQLLLEDDERCVCDHEGPEEGDAAVPSSSSFPAVA